MNKTLRQSFKRTLLDTPIPKPKVKFLPTEPGRRFKSKVMKLAKPLAPTEYKPPKPKPKPRTIRQKKPVPLPRPIRPIPKSLQLKVKSLIDQIAPYYSPEAVSEYKRTLKYIPERQNVEIVEKARALNNNAKSYEVPIVNVYDASAQLYDTKASIGELFRSILESKKGFKFNMTLQIRLSKRTGDGKTYREPYFNSDAFTVTNTEGITQNIDTAIEKILNTLAKWLSEGSGWVIELVLYHYINIVTYFPLRGRSYFKLPEALRNPRKGLVNMKNNDNECFRWCHIRHLNPVKVHPERVTQADREYVLKLDYSGVTFPVAVKDMDRIERQNQINVNVFGWSKNGAFAPIRVSKGRFKDHLELLWIEDENGNSHYVLIYNFNRFMSSFTKHKDVKHFCMHCLKCCSSARTLEMHQGRLHCNQWYSKAVKMPEVYIDKNGEERESLMSILIIIRKCYLLPFVIYADFEALTEKIDSCQP